MIRAIILIGILLAPGSSLAGNTPSPDDENQTEESELNCLGEDRRACARLNREERREERRRRNDDTGNDSSDTIEFVPLPTPPPVPPVPIPYPVISQPLPPAAGTEPASEAGSERRGRPGDRIDAADTNDQNKPASEE